MKMSGVAPKQEEGRNRSQLSSNVLGVAWRGVETEVSSKTEGVRVFPPFP